jgi:hypothetical protein
VGWLPLVFATGGEILRVQAGNNPANFEAQLRKFTLLGKPQKEARPRRRGDGPPDSAIRTSRPIRRRHLRALPMRHARTTAPHPHALGTALATVMRTAGLLLTKTTDVYSQGARRASA